MQTKFKFRLSALTLGVMAALAGGHAMADITDVGSITIMANTDILSTGEGVFIRSNGGASPASYANFVGTGAAEVVGTTTTISGSANLYLNSPITAISNAASVGGTLGVSGASTLNGATAINNTLDVSGTTNINGGSANTTNIGTGIFASRNNIGGVASINTITGASNVIAAASNTISGASNTISGASNTISGASNTISGVTNTITGVTDINASVNSATNINTGSSSAAVTVGNQNNATNLNSATNNLGVNGFATTNNIGTGSNSFASQNNMGNSNAGTTATTTAGNSVVSTKKDAASTIVTGASGTSNLDGGTTTSGASAILLKGGTGTQTVVDANGRLTTVSGAATQSTASLTLTNGAGNTHGLVVTETQASLSGGTNSSTLTMSDNGATFSDARNGNPVQVHGVNDGTAEFDAVNIRQFAGAIASVTAMANIPQVDPDKTYAMGVGVGNFMGRTALAAGVTYRFTSNGVLKGSVSSAMSNSNTTTVGLGAAWSY